MRALVWAVVLVSMTALPGLADEATVRPAVTMAGGPPSATNQQSYRGYLYDLTEIAGRRDAAKIEDALHHQLDIVESVNLSPRVLTYFHTLPIIADEVACFPAEQASSMTHPLMSAACYGFTAPKRTSRAARSPSVWDSRLGKWTNSDAIDLAEDMRTGLVMVRPVLLNPERPIVLHEMLHAFHANMLPRGAENQAIAYFYEEAKKNDLFPADAYMLTNQKEFFAVTASVFLFGKETEEPFSREKLKAKLPEYYKYLAWIFELDPDRSPSPVASVN